MVVTCVVYLVRQNKLCTLGSWEASGGGRSRSTLERSSRSGISAANKIGSLQFSYVFYSLDAKFRFIAISILLHSRSDSKCEDTHSSQ